MGRPRKTNFGKPASELSPGEVSIQRIDLGARKRPVDPEKVNQIAKSIERIGLQTPITVRIEDDGTHTLVTGLHRLRAYESLGRSHIPALLVEWDERSARLWEIAENLHRADLTVQQRSDWVAEWIRLTEDEEGGGQLVHPSNKQPHNKGVSAAAREFGVSRPEVRRAIKIAGISPEAKEAANEAGLSDNQSALLRVAAASAPEDQVKNVHDILEEKERMKRRHSEISSRQDEFKVGLRLFEGMLRRIPMSRWGEFIAACDDIRLQLQALQAEADNGRSINL